VTLAGTATAETVPQFYAFVDKLRLAEAAGQRIFREISPPTISTTRARTSARGVFVGI